ncbi:hypothetical protein HMPREF2533_02508 [Bacteroides fragilis]|nr:hypothetical protein HMPREF2530_02508 [Bacteroides fragilis]KXU44980.1 hypothetical protein HMPREF2533_02508 [Bacteroides fragilis]
MTLPLHRQICLMPYRAISFRSDSPALLKTTVYIGMKRITALSFLQ